MQKKIANASIILCCLILIIFSFSTAFGITIESSENDQIKYRDYEVKKGDTLWDISNAELKDAFLWPNIWKENPEIIDPDSIYPTQHIRIPIYLLQPQVRLEPPAQESSPNAEENEETPAARQISNKGLNPDWLWFKEKENASKKAQPDISQPAEVAKEFLFDRNTVIISGYISPTMPTVGEIVDTPSARSLMGIKGDEIYIKVSGDKSVGRKFYTFRTPGKVSHPRGGGNVGYLIEITGIAQIVGEEAGNTKAVILESFNDIEVGDLLEDYFEIEPPLKTESPRTPDVKGTIVATRDLKELNSFDDAVYVDKGSADGLASGDVLNIISGNFPKIVIGKMVVVFTKENTATAIITSSNKPVNRGDLF